MKSVNFFLVLFINMSVVGCLVTRQEVRNTTKSEPTPEQVKRANQEVRYQETDEQIRILNGRIETLENSINILNADKSGSNAEILSDKKLLNEKLKIYEEAISKLEMQVLSLSQKVEILHSGTNLKSRTDKASANNVSSYEQASIEFNQKKWKEAIVSFEKYRTLNPKGKRYGESTYKIGFAFQELSMNPEARAFYSEVVEKFPKSEWAQKSRQRLKSLK